MKKSRTALITTLGGILLAASASADHGRYQTANVLDATAANQGYVGAAWLMRTADGIRGSIMARTSSGVGNPYTLWIVVFNNPAACDGGCDGSDLANAEVGGSVFNGGGAIVGPGGSLKTNGKPGEGGAVKIDFNLAAHPLPDGLFLLAGDPNGLHQGNGYGAEIHLVIDRHPMPGPGMSWIPDLTTTNFPGQGPATNDSFAVFVPCPDESCPDSVL